MVTTLVDFVGAGNNQKVAAAPGTKAAWIQFIVTGAGTVRIGDANTSINRGLPVPAGGGMFFPWRKQPESPAYDLADIQMFIPAGATVSVAYSPE